MPSLAIVGAGAAGLAAAYALREAPVAVAVFEKSRGLSGRAATRRRETAHGPWHYDHGANYVKAPAGSVARRLLHDALPADGLTDIPKPVWTFDGAGRVRPGEPEREEEGKWTYRQGISQLGKRLAEAAGVRVRLETRIDRLERGPEGWTLHAGDAAHGPFDAVLLTAPAAQSADLLAESRFGPDRRAVLVDGLRRATYRKQFSLLLAFDRALDRPGGAYALLNADREHPVAWAAFESCKLGHVPAGCELVVAQMAPGWTRDHYADGPAVLVRAARSSLAGLLGDLPEPLWADRQRWRYALPDHAADAEALAVGQAAGLFFAGDFVGGSGRVHRALESGVEAAARIRAHLAA